MTRKHIYMAMLLAISFMPANLRAQDTEAVETQPTSAPEGAGSSDAPVAATSEGAGSSDAPVAATSEGTGSSDAPVAATSEGTGSSDAPVAATSEGTGSSDAPVAASEGDSTLGGAATTTGEGAKNASVEAEQSMMPDATLLTDATLDKTLYEVRTRVDTLKEDTFTTKSRLLLLREEVLQRSVSGARLLIRHKDDMGGQYELIKVLYIMDNMPAFSRSASESATIGDMDDQIVYDGITAPGTHQLTVQYVYRGKKWGVFSYMHNYSFVVESGYSFVVDEGKSAELVVTATERGSFFTPYEDRPSISYAFEQYDLATDSDTELQSDSGLKPESMK